MSDTTAKSLASSAMARETAEQLPARGPGVSRAMHLRPSLNGNTDLVDAATGELVSPCSSPEVAERTKAFFAK